MANRSKPPRKPSGSIPPKGEFNMPLKLVEEELKRTLKLLRHSQFLLACIIYQSGGLIEIRDETRDYVKNCTTLDFTDQYDERRKVYVFRAKFGDSKKDKGNGDHNVDGNQN